MEQRESVQARLDAAAAATQNAKNVIAAFRGAGAAEDVDEMLKGVIEEVDFLHQDESGMAMVHYAVQRGDCRMTRLLLKACPNSANVVTHADRNPMCYYTTRDTTLWYKVIDLIWPLALLHYKELLL